MTKRGKDGILQMKTKKDFRIAPIEMGITIISVIIGVGILTLPRGLAEEVGTTDGWISIFISGLFVMIFVYLYTRLQRSFPEQDLIQYIGDGKIGKWLAKLFSIFYLLYWICALAYVARILSIVVKMYLLPSTPSEVIVALILLTTTYAVSKGIQGVIHLNLLFFPIVTITLFLLHAFNIGNLHLNYMLPMLSEGVKPIMTGLEQTFFSFLGIEVLFFLFTYMKKSDIRAAPVNISVAIVTLLYIMITVSAFSIFGLEKTKVITFPSIEVAKVIEAPGGIFERLESLMITIWIMTVFNTITVLQFLSVHILKKHLIQRNVGIWLSALTTFLIFMVAFIPNSISEVFSFSTIVAWLGVFLMMSTLACGYITFWWRKRKNNTQGRRDLA